MGTSNWQNISYCVDIIREINPMSVLDIGVGYGRWGILCREFLDVWEGRTYKESWKLRIDGIEAFDKNVDTYHGHFYDNILVGDAVDRINALELLPNYDLIVIGDVLEHIDKKHGREFFERCLDKGKFILLIVPLGINWPQGERDGNVYEIHRSVWRAQDFKNYNIRRYKYFCDYLQRKLGVFIISKNEKFPRENWFGKIKRYLWFRLRELIGEKWGDTLYSLIYGKITK